MLNGKPRHSSCTPGLAGASEAADIASLVAAREGERFELNSRHLNDQMMRVLKTLGFDIRFQRGKGAYLYAPGGERYLDLLSGFGVFAVGRNHPHIVAALKSTLDADLPGLVQLDAAVLAGVLAERLVARAPYLQKVFFANSGAEAVEAAIKFARASTGRSDILYCSHGYHGLTYGALSLNGDANFRDRFEPLLPGCMSVAFDDLPALEAALSSKRVAAFFVEPIQGKGVNVPADGYLQGVAALCRKYGTLFVADEVQTGMGRTGRFLAVEHWGVEPDMVLLAKALSGGFVPVGAVLMRKAIFEKVFNRMERSVVHGSTFSKNDLAMAAGIATLDVLEHDRLIEAAAEKGARLRAAFDAMTRRYELAKAVRGKGLMLGMEFGAPRSLALKTSWAMVESASKGLFCQMIVIPLFRDHRILTQVAGHASHTVKLLPPFVISDADCDDIVAAFDAVIADAHRVPGAVWSLGKTLMENAMRQGPSNFD